MADDPKDKEQDDNVAVAEGEAEGKPKEEGLSGLLDDGGGDLMDLFAEDEVTIDESLALLTASLSDVNIGDLMEQVRDIRSILDQIQDR